MHIGEAWKTPSYLVSSMLHQPVALRVLRGNSAQMVLHSHINLSNAYIRHALTGLIVANSLTWVGHDHVALASSDIVMLHRRSSSELAINNPNPNPNPSSTLSMPLIVTSLQLASTSINLSPKIIQALENLDRVYYSLNAVLEDIATKSDPTLVTTEVKQLLQNYHVKDNFQLTRQLVDKSHTVAYDISVNNVLEYLTQIYEYFDETIDDVSGRKFPPKEVLSFAQDAIQASQREMQQIFSYYPKEVIQDVDQRIKTEFP